MTRSAFTRDLKRRLRKLIAKGAKEEEQLAAFELELNERELSQLRAEVLLEESDRVQTQSVESIFAVFAMRMDSHIQDLDEIIDIAKADLVDGEGSITSGVLNATVSAIKAKAQLQESVLNHGKDLGLIKVREETGQEQIDGIYLGSATPDEIQEIANQKRAEFERLMRKGGQSAYEGEDDGEIYYDLADKTGEVLATKIASKAEEEPVNAEPEPAKPKKRPKRRKVKFT
jgi:hypothetical protein